MAENLEVATEATDDTWRGALEQSFDKATAATPAEPAAVEPAPIVEAAPASVQAEPQKARDEKGRFAPASTATRPPETGAQEVVAPPATPPASVSSTPEVKPPQSWKVTEREMWAKIPAEAQQAIIRRERETSVAMHKDAAARQLADSYQQALSPYEHVFRAEGLTVPQVVVSLAKTAYTLRTAPLEHRAQVLAAVAKQHGLGTAEGIQYLANALDGTPSPQGGSQSGAFDEEAILRKAEQRLAQRLQAAQQQRTRATLAAELEAFKPQAEFLEDVRHTMAGILDAAAAGGVALSLQEAYDQACWANPEVRKVVQQREASKQAATGAQATQRAKAAASSVRSAPGSAGPTPPGDSWREHLEAAMDRK